MAVLLCHIASSVLSCKSESDRKTILSQISTVNLTILCYSSTCVSPNADQPSENFPRTNLLQISVQCQSSSLRRLPREGKAMCILCYQQSAGSQKDVFILKFPIHCSSIRECFHACTWYQQMAHLLPSWPLSLKKTGYTILDLAKYYFILPNKGCRTTLLGTGMHWPLLQGKQRVKQVLESGLAVAVAQSDRGGPNGYLQAGSGSQSHFNLAFCGLL